MAMKNVLRNSWYCAAWGSELDVGAMIDRTILDERIVLFRDEDGEGVALSNRCPHRFAPLSMGKIVEGGAIECVYHGLRFNAQGSCVLNPHGEIPKGAGVRVY